PRARQAQQAVEELPHPAAAQRDVRADRHDLTQLVLVDRPAALRDLRLLPGDRGEAADDALDQLRVGGPLVDTHDEPDLGQAGHLHDVRDLELAAQRREDLLAVARLEPRHLVGGGAHQISSPDLRETRTLRCAVYVEPSERRLVTSTRL